MKGDVVTLRVGAPVTRVTLLEDRAQVRRLGCVALAPGSHRLRVEAVAPVVVDRSLVARLPGARDLEGKRARLDLEAAVWQRTGEDWNDVDLRFSTARPARRAEPAPALRVFRDRREHREPGRDGIVRWDVSLPGLGTRKLTLVYKVVADRDVRGL